MTKKRYEIPEPDGEYRLIYKPSGDVYNGIDTECFKAGEFYKAWIVNDFSICLDNGTYRMVGITHPKPDDFISDFDTGKHIHEAEYQLFYATGNDLNEIFEDRQKILYPQDRPGEAPEIWAPQLFMRDGEANIIYSPKKMRLAKSRDFSSWQTGKTLFECSSGVARDPFLFNDGEAYYIIYTEGGAIKARKTVDFEGFSDEIIIQRRIFERAEPESPFMLKRNGSYYLFWAIYDGRNGGYDFRTFVFVADTIDGFGGFAPLTVIKAHAPEIIKGKDGNDYLLSVFYPENGVSAVKLKWK